MNIKNILLTLVVVILAFSIVGYIFYTNYQKADVDPFLFIPEDAALILQVDEPGKLFGKLLSDSTIWETATQTPAFKNIESGILRLGAFLNSKPEYFEVMKSSPVAVSFHPDEDHETTGILIISKIGMVPFRRDVKTFLDQNLTSGFSVVEFTGEGYSGFQINNLKKETEFSFTFNEGVMLASSNKSLLEKAVSTYEDRQSHFSLTEDFIQLKESSGDKVEARLYIHYAQLGNLFKSYANPAYYDELDWVNNFAGWTETDLVLKSNELLLGGFTNYNKAALQFLGSFKTQLGNEDRSVNLLPFNTNIMARQGFSDYPSYFDAFIKEDVKQEDVLISNKIKEFVGDEVVFASNASSNQEFDDRSWAIIRLQGKKKARDVLANFASQSGGSSTDYEGYKIKQIKNSTFLSSMFGNMFSVIKNNHYVLIGDYVIFGNSTKSLIAFIRSYKTGKTLDLSENYKLFTDNLSSNANVSLFINPAGMLNLLPRFLNDKTAIDFIENAEVLGHYKGLVFQYCRSESSQFYSNFYLSHGVSNQSDNISLWKVNLSDEIVGQPHLVKDHNTKKNNVIVFDKSANMYLVSSDGLTMWKKRIDDLPISDIYEVDYFKNGKIQYLFNTADFIYLIDKNGELVNNYPMKLNPSATNGLSVFDYNGTRDYRMMFSLADKWIRNYTIQGVTVKGWAKPRMENPVNESITRLLINNKDYFIITDEKNEVKIVNRKGEIRIELNESPKKALNSAYYENKTNNKGIIITTNPSGKLVYINTDGNLKSTDFGDFSESHFFLYEDFNNDGSIDFIFLDNNELKVYNRLKKEIFNYKFNTNISIKPMFFRIGKNQKVLGVCADLEKTIYLFDDEGNIVINKGLVGETPFTVGSINNNNGINLITASGNVLYNYQLN